MPRNRPHTIAPARRGTTCHRLRGGLSTVLAIAVVRAASRGRGRTLSPYRVVAAGDASRDSRRGCAREGLAGRSGILRMRSSSSSNRWRWIGRGTAGSGGLCLCSQRRSWCSGRLSRRWALPGRPGISVRRVPRIRNAVSLRVVAAGICGGRV